MIRCLYLRRVVEPSTPPTRLNDMTQLDHLPAMLILEAQHGGTKHG